MNSTINTKTPMSIRQVVEYTGFSRGYLYKLVKAGKITAYKPNAAKQGRLFLTKESVDNYIFGAGSSNNAAWGVL